MHPLPDQDLHIRAITLVLQDDRCAVSGRPLSLYEGILVDGLKGPDPSDPYQPGLRGMGRFMPMGTMVSWWLLPLVDVDWCRDLCRRGHWVKAAWPSIAAQRGNDSPGLPLEAYLAPFAARVWMGVLFEKEIRAWRHAFAPEKVHLGRYTPAGSPVMEDNPHHGGWVLLPKTPEDRARLELPTWPPGDLSWDEWLERQPDPNLYWR